MKITFLLLSLVFQPQALLGFAPVAVVPSRPTALPKKQLQFPQRTQQNNDDAATRMSMVSVADAFVDPLFYQHMAIGGVLAFAGDVFAQSLLAAPSPDEEGESKKINIPPKNWDVVRTTAFVVFGTLYTGGAQHFIFDFLNTTFDKPLLRLALAQFFFIPFCYYPTFLLMTPALRAGLEFGFGSEEAKTRQSQLYTEVASKIPPTLLRNWCFWLPVQYIQFNFIPVDLNVTFTAAFGVIWNAILSWSTSAASSKEESEVATKKVS